MAQLSVNLDLVAVVRETRREAEPDPAQAAVLAELAGADGIAVQLRRDRKIIRERDLYLLKGVIKSKMIIEMPPAEALLEKALEIKPRIVILVADHADSSSPVSPIEVGSANIDFSDIASKLSAVGITVGFFIEPDSDIVRRVAKAGGSVVMMNCSGYTLARNMAQAQSELDKIDGAAQSAGKNGLTVFAGRGINYRNVEPLMELGNIDEFLIGHAVCSRAMLVGMARAVKEMRSLLRG